MRQFDTLEIQKKFEEKRLILAKNFDGFLQQKISRIGDFFRHIFAAKNTAFFGSLIIIAISILARSTRDIGHDSALCLEIAKKFLDGGKYYQDYFENNLPLFFYFASIPHFLAKIFAINPIIALEIFVNSVGISTVYFSAKILMRSDLAKDRTVFNLVILSLAAGFFIRVYTLQFNEFGTKSTFLIAFAFPYIAYQFLKKTELKTSDNFFIGLLAALLFCLKPHYGILVIVFESAKILEQKSLKPAFALRNYFTAALLILYLVFLHVHFPDYIAAIPAFSSLYFDWRYLPITFASIVKEDIYPLLLIAVLSFFYARKNFSPFFLAAIAGSLIVGSELISGYDQRFAFYSLSLPFVVLSAFYLIKNHRINWKRDGFFIALILFLPQFDQRNIFNTLINFCSFWWVLVLVLGVSWRKKLPQKNHIFLPHNFLSWLGFIALTAFTFIFSFYANIQIFWSFCAVIFILLLNFYQKIHEEFYRNKKLSSLSACTFFLVISYILGLHLMSIFNFMGYESYRYKSPNKINEQMIATIKNQVAADENVTVISSMIPGAYPVLNYLQKENPLPVSNFLSFYIKMDDNKEILPAQKYILDRLKTQLLDKKNKLVFVEMRKNHIDNACRIGFLEYYFRADSELKKIFLQNYVFSNRIIAQRKPERKVEFVSEGGELKWSGDPEFIENDVEIYIRK